jgi:hypothetical protein
LLTFYENLDADEDADEDEDELVYTAHISVYSKAESDILTACYS